MENTDKIEKSNNFYKKQLCQLEALAETLLENEEPEQSAIFINNLIEKLRASGRSVPRLVQTPYLNTIPPEEEPPYPGDIATEVRIKSIIRWNAMAMVVNANRYNDGIGGHISTYASCATLYEVGFNHFFKGQDENGPGDMVFFQGHSTPGIYARAFLEGRLSEQHLRNFRRELTEGGGLSSYSHPYLMPDFWEFPTVSMGLGPILSIYQARFNRYLQARGLVKWKREPKVWCFVGDGETDEPETLGSLTLAARENLDNLIWVVNCNLQRLDGPVRGNGKIIQELEAIFRGAGWNVIKVIWGSEWDPLIKADKTGLLLKRMEEAVDGDYQKYSVEPGSYIRKHFFGKYPELLDLVNHLTDDQLRKLKRGGHDSKKVYAAYYAAVNHKGQPTVILAKTVKGYGLGEAGEGRNISHQQKKLNEKELREFRTRFKIPISDEDIANAPFYKPPEDSPEIVYLKERRKSLGGFIPSRRIVAQAQKMPPLSDFAELLKGSPTPVSTTMAFVRLLSILVRNKSIGKQIVPIIPDEARTFGLDALFHQIGIYSHKGQLYEPVDRKSLLYYKESTDGQILEEGITEAGAMASFISAGTAYTRIEKYMIPFFIYYSMFGFQRIGDLMWLAGDIKAKGFLLGATAGRTTLNGEGLQHQDGHSHLLASTIPTLLCYDPAFAYELAVIIQDGMRRMYEEGEEIFYYLTLYNENYPMPPMPQGAEEGIVKGLYKFKPGVENKKLKAHIFASGPIINCAIKAQEILAERYNVSADVWSATNYKQLRSEALRVRRWNMLHPDDKPQKSYIENILENEKGPFIAVSDNIKAVPDQIAPWVPGGLFTLGTDGFGRSDTRETLRRFFEIDAEFITLATLYNLAKRGEIQMSVVSKAIKELNVNPEKSFAFCV
ncbi:MAG: pyruvate dehydrogenase (acetyl-transferring), homodimeric type [Verrucomicrobiia bacterium]